MKNLLGSLAYGMNSLLSLFILVVIIAFVLWLCLILPNWWIILIVVVLPVAHLLDKYWWRNTEMYHKAMRKLLDKK